MGGKQSERTAEELLAHAAWLRRLALRLVGDADVADDLVQETWIAAASRSPDRRDSLRPWLAKVLRDAFRMRARSEGRRSARERAASAVGDEAVPTPELLVARAEAQQRLVELVLRLDEPYRGALLLHYCEGMSLADIARAQGIPAGTVRWRVKVAIDQLRAWIDEADDRQRRAVTLLALPKGAFLVQKTSKLVAIAALLLLLLVGAGTVAFLWHRGGGRDGGRGGATAHGGRDSQAASALWRAGGAPQPLPTWLAQRGLAARRIAGRVTTAGGVPVPGAVVVLGNLATAGGLVDEPRIRASGDGRFDFGAQPAMTYTVRAAAPGMTGASRTVDLRDPLSAPPADRIELALGPCEAAMFGTVRDASGGPIAGARVTWLEHGAVRAALDDRLVASAAVETGAGGEYELCVIGGRAGVAVEVSADGYGAIVLETKVWGRQPFDFSLVPEAVVVGRVIRADTGEPVARAHVSLSPGEPGRERTARRTTFCDGDGRFRIAGIAPGPHVLGAMGDGIATAREVPILVAAGQVTDEIQLLLEARSTLRGLVSDGDRPVAGALVVAKSSDPGRVSADAVSQEDGSFVLDRVPRGEVRFVVRRYEVVAPKRFQVDRAEHVGVAVEVDALGTIAGRVVRRGRPVEGALVELSGPSSLELEPVRSGPDGRFAARGLRPGTWQVYAGSERDGAFGRAVRDVELERGQTVEVTIELAYSAAIAGVVVDQHGAPVPAASVVFRHSSSDDAGLATTSTDGSFRAAMMMGGGRYRVAIRSRSSTVPLRPAAGGEFPPVELASGDSQVTGLRLAVRLDRLSIAGRVVDESGAAVPDVRVAAEMTVAGVEPRFWRWVPQASTMTDLDGRWSIGDLPSGTYALEARSSAGGAAIVQGVAAGRTDVAITLPSPGSIEGTLVGFADPPRVFAIRQDSRASAPPIRGSVRGTSFAVPSLSPGDYLVSAHSAAEAASARVEVTAGAASRVALTSGGSGRVAGRVRDFHAGTPVQGMSCAAYARIGSARTSGPIGEGDRTGPDGAFELEEVPAGQIAIGCWSLGLNYTDGFRLVDVPLSQRLEVEVPVVRVRLDVTIPLGGLGAGFDPQVLVPRFYRVQPGGPAATAGLQDGDVVTAVDRASVAELSPLGVWVLLTNHPPGTAVNVTVRRGGKELTTRVLLGAVDEP